MYVNTLTTNGTLADAIRLLGENKPFGYDRFAALRGSLRPSVDQINALSAILRTAYQASIKIGTDPSALDQTLYPYVVSKDAKRKYEEEMRDAPSAYMPRKPHKNGLLVYHLAVMLNIKDKWFPYIYDLHPYFAPPQPGPIESARSIISTSKVPESLIKAFGTLDFAEDMAKKKQHFLVSIKEDNIGDLYHVFSIRQEFENVLPNRPDDEPLRWSEEYLKDSKTSIILIKRRCKRSSGGNKPDLVANIMKRQKTIMDIGPHIIKFQQQAKDATVLDWAVRFAHWLITSAEANICVMLYDRLQLPQPKLRERKLVKSVEGSPRRPLNPAKVLTMLRFSREIFWLRRNRSIPHLQTPTATILRRNASTHFVTRTIKPVEERVNDFMSTKYGLRNFMVGPSRPPLVHPGDDQSRKKLLNTIYAEYQSIPATEKKKRLDLMLSGRLWRDYFQPFNLTEERKWEATNKDRLAHLDEQKLDSDNDAMQNVKAALSHQSVKMEGYSLSPGDSFAMYDELRKATGDFCDEIDTKLFVQEYHKTHPNLPPDDIMMYINNTLIQEWIFKKLDDPITEKFILDVHKQFHIPQDNGLIWVFKYRMTTAGSTGYLDTIYPYPEEIACNMTLLVEQSASESKTPTEVLRPRRMIKKIVTTPTIHPVLYALKFYLTFLLIHPFHDGNGRTGRLLLFLMLRRQGHLPPCFSQVTREQYIDVITRTKLGDPAPYFNLCINQMLETYEQQNHMDTMSL
ncbi:hypothetical protein PROFUN_10059 [Planoprotostelium fungivorum]|uniref:Fido domain-containing protein n=1 Tax=Planoprotostelium fungivorum TaxID=1890364 RepID=A0A2P6NFJ4_9EUKA|nr:hypothetical protein PROFUN_10059 [Planoprotostelium fungivorum]